MVTELTNYDLRKLDNATLAKIYSTLVGPPAPPRTHDYRIRVAQVLLEKIKEELRGIA